MFDEPDEGTPERPRDPVLRAREMADELRTHAERCAVFEGTRKFDARVLPKLDAEVARDVQRRVGKLDKAKTPDSPVLPPGVAGDAAKLLALASSAGLSTNDYHVYRRPGEVMVTRWLEGEQVATFYDRFQAHFDAAIEGMREDERQAHAWKDDPAARAYLAALDAVEVRTADRYLRDSIRELGLAVLSTQAADELNIAYLAEQLMGLTPADLVGPASAPPDEPADQDLAWFFKLFSLRGAAAGVERMCFFTYLQKSTDEW